MGIGPVLNAFVAVTDMHGSGTFFDPRLTDTTQFPISAKSGSYNVSRDATGGPLVAPKGRLLS
jgi:hypothetical protein